MKRFVIGDIHGAAKALKQCLERSSFNYDEDQLISLGDVCDGWPETNQSFDELLKIKNLVLLMGNHDYWTLEWALSGQSKDVWLQQGGAGTVKSYPEGMPESHLNLLKNASYYHLNNNKLFVHAGISPEIPIEAQGPEIFLWDRELYRLAMDKRLKPNSHQITVYDEVYIGHTPIHRFSSKPIQACEVWLMDTGAGWNGVLSMMDIDSKEVFTSDPVDGMYPEGSGRMR